MNRPHTAALCGTLFVLGLAGPLAAQGFGQAVLVAGDELLVGESLYATRPGFVYIYRKDAQGRWTEAGRLQASDAEDNDHFGRTLVLAQGDLLVGSTISRESGALYVFERTQDGTWRESAVLTPSDATEEMSFGRMAATDGQTVVMSDWANAESRGAVYVFEKRDGVWQETAKLTASDAQPNDWLGFSVDVQGDRIVTGMPNRMENRGVVLEFRRDASGAWRETARIQGQDTLPNTQFGAAVALAGEDLLVSAPGADGFVGAIYTFRPSESGWQLAGRLQPPAGTVPNNSFGSVLETVGEEVWAGTPGVDTGRIFRLARDGADQWSIAGEVTSTAVEQGDGFGGAIAASESVLAVGAIGDDFGYGSVVVLERQGERWADAERLVTEVEGLDPVVGGKVDCTEGTAASFDCNGVDLLSFLPVQDIGAGRGVEVNDVWGWTDARTGKEWAIVGRFDGTSFIDVSDPSNPVYVGDLPKHEGSRANTWRDIKVHEDHAFIVADGAGQHGMQVFDLTRLRDVQPADMPVTFTEDAHYDNIASSHNIVINEETGFAYAVGASSGGETCGGGLHMIDIREPKKPVFAGCFQDTETGNQRTGYSHDAQCVIYNGPDEEYRGREICFGSNETALSIADVTDKANPKALSHAAYPNVGYAHQGWLDEQHQFFYMNDEGDETAGTVQNTRTLVWDVKDLDDPVLAKEYFGPSRSSDHNLYIVGDLMYQSNYVSGLRIVDISNRAEPREIGFFDTVKASDDPGFDGSWSNYPFFASGTIVVTSGKEGVFMLRRKTQPIS